MLISSWKIYANLRLTIESAERIDRQYPKRSAVSSVYKKKKKSFYIA